MTIPWGMSSRLTLGNAKNRMPPMLEKQQILNRIDSTFNQSIEVKRHFLRHNRELLVRVVHAVADCLKAKNKLLVFGNGGSACDAQHFVGEFVNRFMHDREPLSAIALTADMCILTS